MARDFRLDWQEQYYIVDVEPNVTGQAMDLAETHGLRGYDAVHLAAALQLQEVRRVQGLAALTFVSADDEQLRAAGGEGLPVQNPNDYP